MGNMEATESIFTEVFGATPHVKILGFFLTFDSFDYSKSQIAKETGVSRITVDKVIHNLEKEKIIIKSRVIGRAQLYKLNSENPIVKTLEETNNKLSSEFAESEIQDKVLVSTVSKSKILHK